MIRAAAVVAVALLVGCGSPTSSPSPLPSPEATVGIGQSALPIDPEMALRACQFGAVVFDVGPVVLCQKAVALAIDRLGPLHWPITSIQFVLSLCPPGAPCAVPTEKEGWVVFAFAAGDPLMVHVGPALAMAGVDGPLVPDAPEQLPAWLKDQLAGHRGP